MTEVTKHEPGSFSWAELATSDPQSAKKFYTGLFGWSIKDNPMGEGFVYTLLQIGGKDVAALYQLMKEQAEQGVPPNWMCYVAVESADETAKKAKTLGGKMIAEPFDVMDYGRMAVIQDPEGAILSIWQPMTHTGVQRVEEPGTMCWCELSTRDAAKAGKFYSGLFGWNVKTSDPAYHEIHRGSVGDRRHPAHERACPRRCRPTGESISRLPTATPPRKRPNRWVGRSVSGRRTSKTSAASRRSRTRRARSFR